MFTIFNYFFNISEGNHRIILKSSEDKRYPVLLRMLKKDFDKVSKNRNELTPMVFQSNYKVMVEGLKVHTPRSPLPSESKKDILQIRAVVDGVPFLHSSSYVSTYLVEQRTTHSLAGEFIANLTSINLSLIHI